MLTLVGVMPRQYGVGLQSMSAHCNELTHLFRFVEVVLLAILWTVPGAHQFVKGEHLFVCGGCKGKGGCLALEQLCVYLVLPVIGPVWPWNCHDNALVWVWRGINLDVQLLQELLGSNQVWVKAWDKHITCGCQEFASEWYNHTMVIVLRMEICTPMGCLGS